MSNYSHDKNLVDLYGKSYQDFAEATTTYLLDDLTYKHEQNVLCVDVELEAKEELDRRMQYICDSLEYYGFKPTCDIIDKKNKEK